MAKLAVNCVWPDCHLSFPMEWPIVGQEALAGLTVFCVLLPGRLPGPIAGAICVRQRESCRWQLTTTVVQGKNSSSSRRKCRNGSKSTHTLILLFPNLPICAQLSRGKAGRRSVDNMSASGRTLSKQAHCTDTACNTHTQCRSLIQI